MPSRALPHRSLLKSKCDEASVSRHVETKERCEHPKHHLGSLADTFFPPGRPRKGPRMSTMDFQQSLTVIAPSATSTRGPNRLKSENVGKQLGNFLGDYIGYNAGNNSTA